MTFDHLRFRRRVTLLALGALEGTERASVAAHLDRCARCRQESERVAAFAERIASDSVAAVAPRFSPEALEARVRARLEEELATPRRGAPWRLVFPLAAAALVAALVLLPRPETPTVSAPQIVSVPQEMMTRMEKRLAREQTARYLNEAQDVLMTVATLHRNCLRESQSVDVRDDVDRSRELLRRRALLVESGREEVAVAEPLLADVEELLRDVADLPSCARSRDQREISRRMSERRLLMKIDLMSRELQG